MSSQNLEGNELKVWESFTSFVLLFDKSKKPVILMIACDGACCHIYQIQFSI